MDNFSSGDGVETSAIDASAANASDTNTAQTESGNVWGNILANTGVNDSTVQADNADDSEEATEEATDDEIPGEETGEKSDDAADEKKNRSGKFKELQESNSALEETVEGLKKQLSTLDVALETVGGAEQIGSLIENQNKFIDPARFREATDYIFELPQGSAIQTEILNRSFDLGSVALDDAGQAQAIANRVTMLNSALAKDFGLTANLSAAEMTAAFQWLAVRANKDKAEMLSDIQDELDLLMPEADYPKVDKKTQERIDALEQKVKEQEKTKEGEKKTDDAATFDPVKANETLDAYEAETISEIAAEVLKDFNTTLDKLPEIQREAIEALVFKKIGKGVDFATLAQYILENKKDHPNAKYLATQYKNKVRTLIRTAANSFMGKPAATPTTKKPQTGITGTGKSSIKTAPKTKEENSWSEYVR